MQLPNKESAISNLVERKALVKFTKKLSLFLDGYINFGDPQNSFCFKPHYL